MLIQLILLFKYLLKYSQVIFIFFFLSCNRSDLQDSIDMNWTVIDNHYPNNIQLYSGYDSSIPIRAWTVIIPKNNKNRFKVLISDDDDGVQTPNEFSIESEALVVINGGYFLRGSSPMRHVGLLKSGGQLIEPASKTVIKENIRYDIARGAVGFFENDHISVIIKVNSETLILGEERDWTAYRADESDKRTCFISSEPKSKKGDYNKENRGDVRGNFQNTCLCSALFLLSPLSRFTD